MLFSSAEVKEHTKSYVTATPVTQKREKVPSYLLFARLSAVRIPEVIILHIKRHRIERCLLYMVELNDRKSNKIMCKIILLFYYKL